MSNDGVKGNYGTFIGIAASALVILAIFAFTQLEIYERTRRYGPSSEVWSDNFYVIGKWLGESGHPVRFRPRWTGTESLSPQEGALYIQASLYDWEDEEDGLLSWVRGGGYLLISIDAPWYRERRMNEAAAGEDGLERLLENLGVTLRYPVAEQEDEDDDLNETGGAFPVFDRGIALELGENFPPEQAAGTPAGPLALRDRRGAIRLVRLPLGKGRVTVTGECYFMYTRYLNGYRGNEENIRAAWEFTGASIDPERPGMLFVRGRRAAKGFWGTLLGRGNLAAPVVSALVLIVIGFWMVIPGFGIPLTEERRRHVGIAGRFRAEARFLGRYEALRTYLDVYLQVLHRHALAGRGERKLGQDVEEVEQALAAGKKTGRRKMAVYLRNLMSALERI